MRRTNMILIATCLVVCVLTAALVGCSSQGKYLVTMCVSKQTPTSFSMEYESFDGYRIYKFTLKKTTEVNLRFETVKGKLSCHITDEDGEVMYDQEDVASGGFGVNYPKGTYTVRLTADHHQGSFSFYWDE